MLSPVHVLLVSGAWRLRVPLRAQLLEEGYEVHAVATWDEAELLLRTRAIVPGAAVIDLEAADNPEAELRTLAKLVAPDRVVMLTSAAAALRRDEIVALGFAHVLARPYSIRDVVEAVKAIGREG